MATYDELLDRYRSAETQVREAQQAQPNAQGLYRIGGRVYNPEQYRTYVRSLQQKRDRTKKGVDALLKAANDIRTRQQQNREYAREAADPRRPPSARRVWETRIQKNNEAVRRSTALLEEAGAADLLRAATSGAPVPSVEQLSGVQAGPGRAEEAAAIAERQRLAGMEQPAGPAETPVSGGAGRGSAGADRERRRREQKPKVSWEEQLRKFFPQQAWMLDLDRTKYPQLFDLLERAYTDGMWKSAEGLARFQAELANTDFGIELRDKGVNTAIKTTVGDLGFGTENYNKFIVNAANFGWEGDQLVREVYREAFRKNNDGTYANETARERALKSNDYLTISNIGTQFFTRISEDTVQKVLTGDMARDDVERQQRELAKSKYGHLANLIDQGFTMQELANPYRQIASNLLERTADDVDMAQPDFEAAYNFTDEQGNKRLMTEGEWERLIKSDAKYGWQNTANANRTARSLAQSIAQSFGRLT